MSLYYYLYTLLKHFQIGAVFLERVKGSSDDEVCESALSALRAIVEEFADDQLRKVRINIKIIQMKPFCHLTQAAFLQINREELTFYVETFKASKTSQMKVTLLRIVAHIAPHVAESTDSSCLLV